jgi:hypothetical protein
MEIPRIPAEMKMADDDKSDDGKRPPYIAFQSLKTLISNMKENGVPGRVDKSVLSNFSGAVGGQIITGLKFLSLIDEGNHPNKNLRGLVNSFGSEDWPEHIGIVLKSAFAPIFELNLETASPAQFTERFKNVYGIEGDTLRKCITFFVNGVREAQIPISSYIIKNKKPRSGPTKKRTTKNGDGKPAAGGKSGEAKPIVDPIIQTSKPLSQQVLDVLDMNKMSEDEVGAVWTLLKYLRKEGK